MSTIFAQSASACLTRKLEWVTSVAIFSTRILTFDPVALTQFSSLDTSSSLYFSGASDLLSRIANSIFNFQLRAFLPMIN